MFTSSGGHTTGVPGQQKASSPQRAPSSCWKKVETLCAFVYPTLGRPPFLTFTLTSLKSILTSWKTFLLQQLNNSGEQREHTSWTKRHRWHSGDEKQCRASLNDWHDFSLPTTVPACGKLAELHQPRVWFSHSTNLVGHFKFMDEHRSKILNYLSIK